MTDSNKNNAQTMPSLFHISWPIFIDIGLHFATLLINIYMVGLVSVKAVGELTVGNQVFDLGVVLFNFVNIGVCVVCAQALGNENKSMVQRVIHMGLGLNIIWGTIVAVGIFFLAGFITSLMNVPPEIYDNSCGYLRILALCFLPEAINLCCAQILRAYGHTRESLYVCTTMNLITVALNYILLFGAFGMPQMGVQGVAAATVIGRSVSVFIFIYIVVKLTHVRIDPRFIFVIKTKILKQILNIGLPGAGENLSVHAQNMVLTSVIASLGAISLSTHGIYFQMVLVMCLWSIAISFGTEVIVARYAGAMKLKLANKRLLKSVKIGFIFTVLLAITVPLFSGKILFSLFTDSEEALAVATPIFLLTAFMEPGRVLNIIIINSLRSVGDTKFPLIMALISMWGISVPLGTFLSLHCGLGLLGIWIGFCADEWTRAIAMCIRWKSKAWVKYAVRNYRVNFMKHNQEA